MKIPILMYHQIDQPPPRGTPLRGLVVAPSSFAWQMKMLRLLNYQALSMRDLEPYLFGKKVGRVVGITFDDGFRNNLVNAMPILKKHGFTGTCYGVSGLIGGTNSWDHGKVAPTRLMTREDWMAWYEGGMDIGSHTRTHARLTDLPLLDARAEIARSRQELEQAIGCEVRHFCYPYGLHGLEHIQMAREAGYATATTTHRGRVVPGDNPYTLRRIMVARATNPLQFFMKVATSYEDRHE